jgi:uncharacterized protein (TIGR04255 family)
MVELRFESETPADIVVALIYNAVRGTWGEGQVTPIAQLPKEVIALQPELKFQASRRWVQEDKGRYLNAGPYAITVGMTNFESGQVLISLVGDTFRSVESIFGRVTRLGLRYVNFFEAENVFEKAALKVSLRGEVLGKDPTYVRAELDKGKFVCALQVMHPANAEGQGKKKRTGSVIDIDVSTKPTTAIAPNVAPIVEYLGEMHKYAEQAFFSTLSDEYVATLKPEYA